MLFVHTSNIFCLHVKHPSPTYQTSFVHLSNIICPHITYRSSIYQISFVHISNVIRPHLTYRSSTCHRSFVHISNIIRQMSNIFRPHITYRLLWPNISVSDFKESIVMSEKTFFICDFDGMRKFQPENAKDSVWCSKTWKLINVRKYQNEKISTKKC